MLDFDIKDGSNHENNTKYEFLMPKCPRKHVLCNILSQSREKLIFTIAVGGHFGIWTLKSYAHHFARGTQAKFFIYTSYKSNPLRNGPFLSTVTEFFDMTQLYARPSLKKTNWTWCPLTSMKIVGQAYPRLTMSVMGNVGSWSGI